MIRLRSSRGYSLIELLVVMALSAAFGIVIVQAVDTVSRATIATTSRSDAQQEARTNLDAVARYLKAARPLGKCLDPGVVASPLSLCSIVGEEDFVVAEASSTRLVFYAYVNEEGSVATPEDRALRFPDKVVVDVSPETRVVGGESFVEYVLSVQVFAPHSGLEYTDRRAGGNWQAAPVFTRRIGTLPAGQLALLEYFDEDGNPLPLTSGALDAESRKRVALIEFSPTFTHRAYRGTDTFSYDLFVALPSNLYSREVPQ